MAMNTSPITVRCPRCGARVGQPCVFRMRPLGWYHEMRRVVAHKGGSEAERQRQFRIAQEMQKP